MGGWLYLSSVYRDKYRAYKKSLIRKCLAQGASWKMSRNVKKCVSFEGYEKWEYSTSWHKNLGWLSDVANSILKRKLNWIAWWFWCFCLLFYDKIPPISAGQNSWLVTPKCKCLYGNPTQKHPLWFKDQGISCLVRPSKVPPKCNDVDGYMLVADSWLTPNGKSPWAWMVGRLAFSFGKPFFRSFCCSF